MIWNYRVGKFDTASIVSLERELAAAGAEGWELVAIVPHPVPPPLPPQSLAIFKRPAVQ